MQTRVNNLSYFSAGSPFSITDATVFPIPSGNTSLRRMAVEAEDLGFDSIVAIGREGCEIGGFQIIGGILSREIQIKSVIRASRNNANGKNLHIVNAGDNAFNRAALQVKGVHVIRHLHKTEKNSFDHITARLSAENQVAIDIDVRPLVMARGIWRQKAIQRYTDILRLKNRFEFPLTLSTNARSLVEQKSVREIVSLLSLIGMEEEDVMEALATVGFLLSPKGPVRVVG
jgi:ribonuclease P/MRP protein subunit RPP1